MATIIVPSDLTVTITENYNLNGVDYGNTMNKTYISNGQVSQRVMSIASLGAEGTVWTDILALGNGDGQGQVVKGDYKYFRITNLDTVNTLNLRVYNGTEYVALNVLPASSFLLMDNGVDVPSGATGAATFVDIQLISGQSSSATDAIDVEFVMVTA
tara:strand:+ start:2959 stop:3429 length:471 start_codon:yes stop_codon:yes gene_type:complete